MGQPMLDEDGAAFLDEHGAPLFLDGPLFFPFNPTNTAWPVDKHPTWDTLVQRAYSGKKTSIPRRGDAIYEYTIDLSVLRIDSPSDYQDCFTFLNTLLGQFGSFYYDDPNDDTAVNQIFGIGDASTTQFQLMRMFGYTTDIIQMLQGDAPVIQKDGVTLNAGIDYTIDGLGVVTMTVAPAADSVLTWSGMYYWLCQLTLDKFALSEFVKKFFEMKKLTFETILL